MRPFIDSIVETLLARHRALGRVDLNDIAEVIGPRRVSHEEVEYIVTRLEADGIDVGEPLDASEIHIMRAVIRAARDLRAALRRSPTVTEIAENTGHPAHVVRRALERGRSPAVLMKYVNR